MAIVNVVLRANVYFSWFLLLLHISLFVSDGSHCSYVTRAQWVEWSVILPYASLAAEVCCGIPDLLNCLSVQCWWVMVLHTCLLSVTQKYIGFKLHFSARNRPTVSPWHASWDFAIDQVFSGSGKLIYTQKEKLHVGTGTSQMAIEVPGLCISLKGQEDDISQPLEA